MPPTFAPEPLPWGPPPVMMGALGPVMTRTAGEVADGLLIMPFNTARHIRERTLPALREGISRAGRAEAEVACIAEVITAVGDTDEEIDRAAEAARHLVAFYASTPAYRPVLEAEGRDELQPRLQQLMRQGRYAEMAAAVDDDLLDLAAVRGTPAQCAASIAERFSGVTDRVRVYFPYADPDLDAVAGLVSALHAPAR